MYSFIGNQINSNRYEIYNIIDYVVLGAGCTRRNWKKLKYIDAEELTIVNKTQPVGPKLQRLDVERYPQLSKKLKEYFSYSTGLAVAFKRIVLIFMLNGKPQKRQRV